MQVQLKMTVHFARTAELESRPWPPPPRKPITTDRVTYYSTPDYVEQVKELSPEGTIAGPGEVRLRYERNKPYGEYKECLHYYEDDAAELCKWDLSVRTVHTFRYSSLVAAAGALCPEQGLSAFVYVRGLPSLFVEQTAIYRPGKCDVWICAPVGVMLGTHGEFRRGTTIAIITESETHFGVTRVGAPGITLVSKSKVKVVVPIIASYNTKSDEMTIHFRRMKLDHYCLYDK